MGNRIHPSAVIGDGVSLGDDNVIGPFAVIVGPAVIGSGNWIGPHVTIGTPASHRAASHPAAWDDELTGDPDVDGHGVTIGDGNRIREYFSAHQGTQHSTDIGSHGYFLRGSHVAHDCVIGDDVTLGSNVVVGGHSEVWSLANLGLGVTVHQRGKIGPGAMVGMGAVVRGDIGPFSVSVGVPARVTGVNTVGLSRSGVADDVSTRLESCIKEQRPWDVADGDLPAEVTALVRKWESTGEALAE
ncbi:acyl-ACP--UDP-N-acetylglucosamine O-acyltransferase family protein [Haloechinothrix halophila]|uniref:UDP-N-acetylglucosamine acyltransferase n=1 Tax=Haloechinothrix halophila TaxID=1069073 RepID=UPI0004022A3C|nr:UDP-N-acetylglucosamine acyltransferase [Haloechinothrix halophila]